MCHGTQSPSLNRFKSAACQRLLSAISCLLHRLGTRVRRHTWEIDADYDGTTQDLLDAAYNASLPQTP